MDDIYRPENLANPFPLLARYREIAPVVWDPSAGEAGAWIVTGYDAAVSILEDRHGFSAVRPQWLCPAGAEYPETVLKGVSAQLFCTDDPQHGRLRRALAQPFKPRAVRAMSEVVTALAHELFDRFEDRAEFDFMADYAMALPSITLCRLLGVPESDRTEIWNHILSWGLLIDNHPFGRGERAKVLAGVGRYLDYFKDQARTATDGLLGELLGEQAGAFDSDAELYGNLMFLMTAGQTTTAHQMGNTVRGLFQPENEHTLAAVRRDPRLCEELAPEFLRYDCSVAMTQRRCVAPTTIASAEPATGDEILVWLSAANRDPSVFPDPDRILLNRGNAQRHLGLGHGAHYCLGGQLGQLVNTIGLTVFFSRIRDPHLLRDRLTPMVTAAFRGPQSMPFTHRTARSTAGVTTIQE